MNKGKSFLKNRSLASSIRLSYVMLVIPFLTMLIISFANLWENNRRYEALVDSTVVASQFSLDFKSDFDYETYLLIVGNKSLEESGLREMLRDADEIVAGLEQLTDSGENMDRLVSIQKYLKNLSVYVDRIETNLSRDDKYEDNLEIWENDVQIVTDLVQDTMSQYIYYEVRSIQNIRAAYQESFFANLRIFVLATLLILVMITIMSFYIPRTITRPITDLVEVTEKVAAGDLTVRAEEADNIETRLLGQSMNTMMDKINELLDQVKQEQISLRKAEFELLQAQINPHFLYNTLDAIIWLAEAGDQKRVVSTVGSLSDFFRLSLNEGKDIITVREELQHVRSYLEIQHTRYQDILQFDIRVPEELLGYIIPKITLQPLVENALYHGIKNKRGGGVIIITGEEFEEWFELTVKDNGIGMTEERLQEVQNTINNGAGERGEGIFGLYNVNGRIRLDFGDEYGLRANSVYGEGTEVVVRLPKTSA